VPRRRRSSGKREPRGWVLSRALGPHRNGRAASRSRLGQPCVPHWHGPCQDKRPSDLLRRPASNEPWRRPDLFRSTVLRGSTARKLRVGRIPGAPPGVSSRLQRFQRGSSSAGGGPLNACRRLGIRRSPARPPATRAAGCPISPRLSAGNSPYLTVSHGTRPGGPGRELQRR
jgi:hypothetical protein